MQITQVANIKILGDILLQLSKVLPFFSCAFSFVEETETGLRFLKGGTHRHELLENGSFTEYTYCTRHQKTQEKVLRT